MKRYLRFFRFKLWTSASTYFLERSSSEQRASIMSLRAAGNGRRRFAMTPGNSCLVANRRTARSHESQVRGLSAKRWSPQAIRRRQKCDLGGDALPAFRRALAQQPTGEEGRRAMADPPCRRRRVRVGRVRRGRPRVSFLMLTFDIPCNYPGEKQVPSPACAVAGMRVVTSACTLPTPRFLRMRRLDARAVAHRTADMHGNVHHRDALAW